MLREDGLFEVTLTTEHLKTIRVRPAYVSVDERLPGPTPAGRIEVVPGDPYTRDIPPR